MFPSTDSDDAREDRVLAERVDSLVSWVQELDGRLKAAETATGDPKTAKELRKAIEALAKHDPKLEERLTNQVSVLKDRLAMLAETVSAASAGLAARDGEIAGLRRELEAERAHLQALAVEARSGAGGAPRKELEELRRAIAELSGKRSRGTRDAKDGVPNTLEIVEQRLDTLAKTVATASASLASKDGEIAALRRRLEEDGARLTAALAEVRDAVDPALVAELRLNVKELAGRTAELARRSEQGTGELREKLEALSSQLAGLGQTVAATSGGLASGEQTLLALRTSFDEETGRLDAHVAAIEQTLAQIGPRLAALADAADRASVDVLEEQHRWLADRLEGLGREVQETGRGNADRQLELEALSRRFDEGRAQVEELIAGVRSEVQALAEHDATDALEAHVHELSHRVDEVSGRLAGLDEAGAGTRAELAEARAQVAGVLEDLSARMEALAHEHAQDSQKLTSALETSQGEREALAGSNRLLEERVHGVSESVGSVSRRLEELASAVERGVVADSQREQELAALSRRFDEGRAQVEALVTDLRQHVESLPEPGPDPEQEMRLRELADEIARQANALAAATDGLAAREHDLEELRGAVGGLAQSVEAAAGAESEREREVAAVARRLDENRAQVDELIAELRSELRSLAEHGATEALEGRVREISRRIEELAGTLEASQGEREALAGSSRLLEERVHGVSASVDFVSRGLEELASAVERGGEAESQHEQELSALSRRFDELRSEMQALSEHGATEALETRLHEVSQRIEGLAGTLGASQGEREALAGSNRLLEERVHGVSESVDSVSRRIDELAGTIGASQGEREALAGSNRLLEERVHGVSASVDSVSRRIDELAGAVEQGGEAESERERELATLSRRFDEGRAQVEALVGDLRQALETMPEPGPDEDLLDQVDSLETRVEGIAAALRSSASQEETERLLGKLLLRLDVLEHAQQTLAGEVAATATETFSGRLDELAARLEQAEAAGRAAADGPDSRTRQELRELALRVEHQEDLARESREAVLTQLERLASRMEWRLLRLEEVTGTTDVVPKAPSDGARVVPIRGSEV